MDNTLHSEMRRQAGALNDLNHELLTNQLQQGIKLQQQLQVQNEAIAKFTAGSAKTGMDSMLAAQSAMLDAMLPAPKAG